MSTTTNAKRRIEIYDTTLRDGTQGEGFNLSLQDKVMIAQKLDELGVDYIEGGFPGSNEKDRAFFQEVKRLDLKHAKVHDDARANQHRHPHGVQRQDGRIRPD